jgi:homoserine O-succinyltransferase
LRAGTDSFRGFDDEFLAPQSRHTASNRDAIVAEPALIIESETEESGIFIATAREGREIYVTGHLEYDPLTLDREYRRDLARGLPIAVPKNYYPGDDPARAPVVRWRAHAHLFFFNWLNYVYQETPYDLREPLSHKVLAPVICPPCPASNSFENRDSSNLS